MSLIANLIRHNPDNWREILREKGIAFRTDGTLASFNYRISADFFDPVVQEARGIILDMENLDVVCYPFRKFGNYGEPYIDDIDWNTARVLEKVDGSIMKVYWYDGRWCLATNSTINADNTPVSNTDKTFGGLFREAAENQGLDFDVLDKNKTYIFELTSPYNKVVVDYGETPKIWHLGTRDNITGQESEENIGIVKPKEYLLSNLDSCIEAVKMMNSVRGFARMLYSSSETQIKDCTGDYKVDKKWLRGLTDGLAVAFRHDGYLKNGFYEYVAILNDIGRIWAARLLKEHSVDMHELEKETGVILYPVAESAQDPDGHDHGNYKYYVNKGKISRTTTGTV